MNFLVAVDGSKPADTAFDYVLNLGVKKVDKISLLTSVKGTLLSKPSSAPGGSGEKKALEMLTPFEERIRSNWLNVGPSKILYGDPRKTVCKYVEDVKDTILVVGARGLGTLMRVVLGSVSSYLVSHAKSAVMVVKGNLPNKPRKFLYCYDGSEPSKNAFPMLLRLARPGDSAFLLHVVQELPTANAFESPDVVSTSIATETDTAATPVESPEEQARITMEISNFVEQFKAHGLNTLAFFEHGSDARDVACGIVKRMNIDMVVVGCSGRSGLHWYSMGSFSSDMVQNAEANAVLVIKPTHERVDGGFSDSNLQ